MDGMRRRACLALALMGLLLAVAGRAPSSAASRPVQSAGLSPEEAVIALKPYELSAADLPSGYAPGAVSTSTPSLEAIAQAASGADPYAALDRLQAEGTQVCSVQALTPASGATLSRGALTTCVMASPDAAQAVAAGSARPLPASSDTVTVTPTALAQALGDGTSAAWQIVSSDSSGQPQTEYDLRWTRGLIAFELRTTTTAARNDIAASAALGAALDSAEATRAAVVLGAPTVTPPASEVERVYTALLEQRAVVPVSQPPQPTSTLFLKDVIHPAEQVRAAANPTQALHTVDEVYQRVITADQIFLTRDRIFAHGERITVNATAQGALAELNTPSVWRPSFRVNSQNEALPNPQVTFEQIPAPIQLGDNTAAYRFTVSYPSIPNTPSEISYSIGWTHGRVFLQARYGAPDTRRPTVDGVVPFAQQVEADFQASDLATMTADTAPSPSAVLLAPRPPRRAIGLDGVLPPGIALPLQPTAGAARRRRGTTLL